MKLIVNGKNMGKKAMPKNGHLAWDVVYQPGTVKAYGYKRGKRILTQTLATTGNAEKLDIKEFRHTDAHGLSTIVYDITLLDRKNRFVPTACNELTITAAANTTIAGVGNGDPSFQAVERPANGEKTFRVKAFNGHAQVIVESRNGTPKAQITM